MPGFNKAAGALERSLETPASGSALSTPNPFGLSPLGLAAALGLPPAPPPPPRSSLQNHRLRLYFRFLLVAVGPEPPPREAIPFQAGGGDPGGGAQRLLPGLPLPVCSLASQSERREICVGALRVVVGRRAPFVPAVGPCSPHPPPRRWSALWSAQYQASLRMLRLGAPTSPFLTGVLIGCSDCSGCSGPESWLFPFESFIGEHEGRRSPLRIPPGPRPVLAELGAGDIAGRTHGDPSTGKRIP